MASAIHQFRDTVIEKLDKATGQVVEELNKSKPTPKEGDSFDTKEHRYPAKQISRAANDTKNLPAAVVNFPDTRGYKSVVNNLSLRVEGLTILIFILAVLYRMIAVRLKKKST